MQGQSSVFGGPATSLELRYTGKPVSGWGGLLAVMRYLEARGVRRVLEAALPDGRTSPNQIPVVDLVVAFLAAVLTGGRRFAHVERLRTDKVVQAILGLARMPSAMTLTRYFGGLVRSQVEQLSAVLGQFMFGRLPQPPLGATLDLDSTVFERYGRQEGSLKGYNPRKHGRPSHHPLLAILAEAKLVLHAWLRSGNTAIADFKREVIQNEAPRLSTLRTQVLVIGAILGREGRHTVLRLGLRERWRQRFAALLQRIIALAISTVAQLTDYAKNLAPRPWKPRRPGRLPHLALVPN